MDQKEILRALPHRYPFLMVDKILEIQYEKYVTGIKNVSINEPWVTGHFPEAPIFPGVLMIETMAQISGFMFYDNKNGKEDLLGYLCGINKFKIIKKVFPGDVLVVEAELKEKISKLAQVKCIAKVNGELAATGVLSYAFEK